MKNFTLLLGTILLSSILFSQTDRMNVNSINARVTASGVMFHDTTTGLKPGFEALKDSGTSSIFSSSLTFTGVTRFDSTLKGTIDLYGNKYSGKLFPGPLSVFPGINTDPAKRDFGPANPEYLNYSAWDKVFCVTRLEIEVFKQWYACDQDPACNIAIAYPGYSVPLSIWDWPAHGDISKYHDYYVAPFFDKNSDGDYNPADGDFPCIKGDKYCWYLLNDKQLNYPNGIGLEIHVEVYAFDKDISDPVDRTLFVGYDIINRSTATIDSFNVSHFVDFDLGCGSDDYIGSLPNLNSVFAYNGDAVDDNCSGGAIPFGTNPPAQSITVLNRTLTGAMYFNNSSGNQGYPTNLVELNNYLTNKWKNGTHLEYGGNGYPSSLGGTSTSGVQTNYIFPDPNPSGMTVWNEVAEGNAIGDRRAFANTGGVTLTPGEIYELDVAYIYSRSDSGGNLASVNKLKREIPLVQAFFNDSILPCSGALVGTLSQTELFKDKVSVFPNPFSESIDIKLKDNQGEVTVEVVDAFGKLILREVSDFNTKTIYTGELAKGIYFLKVINNKQEFFVEKLIKL